MEALAGLGIVFNILAAVVGILLVLSPLFIWHHVAKMRKEMDEQISSLSQTASSLLQATVTIRREQAKTNELFVEMQQRYIKTMQYVCDCLADICDNTGGSSATPADEGLAKRPIDTVKENTDADDR